MVDLKRWRMAWKDLHTLRPMKGKLKKENDNCLDGEEDGDAPEKGGNGGGRPAHTEEKQRK